MCGCIGWVDGVFAYNENGAVDDAIHPTRDADVGELGEIVLRPLQVHLCA